MKSVDTHLAEVLRAVAPLPPLPLPLADAHGCVLAEDVTAAAPLPGFDNSAMDGYAVRLGDVANASPERPASLPVLGDIAAGARGGRSLQAGCTLRIMTGAPMPVGADAVVPLEWTDGGTGNVSIRQAPSLGQHVRRAGEEAAVGATLLPAGTFLGAAQIALIAAANRSAVSCRPRPRVVVLSTGSELLEAGSELEHGQIPDSNSHMLLAAVREAGATGYRVGMVPDDPNVLLETLEDHLIRADAVVTTGGVSVGAYDVVKEVLSRLGTVAFDKVAMQPGMPQGFGTIGADEVPIFTLPGNPVSALVSFEVFVRPALRRMLGGTNVLRPQITVETGEEFRSPPGKRSFLRVLISRDGDGPVVARAAGGQGSHMLTAMAHANALLVVPEEMTEVPVGARLPALLLERRGS